MRIVFADSGYWIAQLDPTDGLHRKAEAVAKQLAPFRIVTTEMVLVEFLAFVGGRGEEFRKRAVERVKSLRADPNVEVVPQTSKQFDAALDLYASRLDKAWSLTDCASFVLMKQRTIREALAHDHNFEQARFIALLSDSNVLPQP